MKTIEQLKEYIKNKQSELIKLKCDDTFELEQSVGKVKFGYELLHYVEADDEND